MIISSEKVSDLFLEVNSCERQILSDRDYTMVRSRGRADFHILYITSGFCTIEDAGGRFRIGAGNIILFRPYEPQKYSFLASDHSVSSYIHFSGTACEKLLRQTGLYQDRITYVGVSNRLETIFAEMEEEAILKRPFYTEICASLLLKFLAAAGRLKEDHARPIHTGSQDNMDRACKYMHKHFEENRPVAFYAAMCSLSVSRFSHAFKERTGMPPKRYMTAVKTDAARRLLETTTLSIAEVSEAVGIADVNYFSRMMKKHTGHSPKYFRS